MKLKHIFYLSLLFFMGYLSSCEKEPDPEIDAPIALFTITQDADDAFTFTFGNISTGATSYTWNFGDGGSSTDENPSHTYASEGTFTVELTATGEGGSDGSSQDVSVVDPNVELKKLTGQTTKTWKLLRDVTTGDQFPAQVGPADRSTVWWAYGLNEPIGSRTCLMDEEYIFGLDGSFVYNTKGEVYADNGIWNDDVAGACIDDTDATAMTNNDGADLSAWGAGTFTFDYDATAGTLTVEGLGAHVGIPKVGTGGEFGVPQTSVTYKVLSLETEGDVDMLTLETDLVDAGGYWQFILVSYDNPADEPELPGAPPAAGFTSEISDSQVTFTNTSENADSYSWDFGDGMMSSEESPVHTYDADGSYTVVLTATNSDGEATASSDIVIATNSVFSLSALTGDGAKVWKMKPAPGAYSVGPCKTCGDWFSNSEEEVAIRACAFDDEYIFDNTGGFEYVSQGSVWAEGYMGIDPAGCTDETALSADAAAWGAGTHTYTLQDADDMNPAYITVKGTGAFIALPKAFNGGEYGMAPPAIDGEVTYEVLSYLNDGTTEQIVLVIDVSENEAGGAYWTFTLISE